MAFLDKEAFAPMRHRESQVGDAGLAAAIQPPGYRPVSAAIPPGPAGSAEQDAILRDAIRPPPLIGPVQTGPGPADPRVTGPAQVGDPRNMAAFPLEVRPEAGSKKELPPQFRRTLVDYYTNETAGTIIIDTPKPIFISCWATARRCVAGSELAARALLGQVRNESQKWRSGRTGIRRKR
jgi:hypothetical protein